MFLNKLNFSIFVMYYTGQRKKMQVRFRLTAETETEDTVLCVFLLNEILAYYVESVQIYRYYT